MFQEAPASADPARNTPRHHSHTRLFPNRPDSHWVAGIAIAMPSR